MLEISPTLGRNDAGEFHRWLVYFRYSYVQPDEEAGPNWYRVHPQRAEWVVYYSFPWVFRGKPDIETFNAMSALGILTQLPHPWPLWDAVVKHYMWPSPLQWETCYATGVSEAAVRAAIQRKEE